MLRTRLHPPPACFVLLRSFLQHSVDTIQSLEVVGVRFGEGNNVDSSSIADFLRSLNGLRTLELARTTSPPWMAALGQKCCPQLRDLSPRQSAPPDCVDLIRFFMERSKAGVPIHRLLATADVLESFHTRPGKVGELRGRVEWCLKRVIKKKVSKKGMHPLHRTSTCYLWRLSFARSFMGVLPR